MITTEEALEIILSHTINSEPELIPLPESLGRILQEVIKADREFPPFNRVTMDGIAVQSEALKSGRTDFGIEGVAAAGSAQMTLENAEACLEVMTGAVLPINTDWVIPYEQVEIKEGRATITVDAASLLKKSNVHEKGFDRKQNDILITSGKKIGSPEIGVCATVGKASIYVSKLPKTIILSTGNELVDIDQDPLPHQIRKSNIHQLRTLLSTQMINADYVHLPDDHSTIKEKLNEILNNYDLVVTSGGVSKGKFDYLPSVLDELGVQKHFHRVKQRPGKPMWFGTTDKTVVFSLPGNPISSFMCANIYLIPWVQKSIGQEGVKSQFGILTDDITFKPDLTRFQEVKLRYDEGKLLATPVKENGSGDLASLLESDAFIKLPIGKDTFKAGESYELFIFRDF